MSIKLNIQSLGRGSFVNVSPEKDLTSSSGEIENFLFPSQLLFSVLAYLWLLKNILKELFTFKKENKNSQGMWFENLWVEDKYTSMLTEIRFLKCWIYIVPFDIFNMSHFIGSIPLTLKPSLIHMHTYVCNYEHITGVILIITWDSNLDCPKIRP